MINRLPSLLVALVFVLFTNPTYSQQNKADSLKSVLEKTPDDTAKITLYNELAYELHRNQTQQAKQYAYLALELAQQYNTTAGIANAHATIALVYIRERNYDSCRIHLEKGMAFAENANDRLLNAKLYNLFGILHFFQGQNSEAIGYYKKALLLFEQAGDLAFVAKLYGNIGLIHKRKGQTDSALHYYYKSVDIGNKTNNPFQNTDTYNNIGILLAHTGQYEKAIEYHQKSLQLKTQNLDKRGISSSLINIAVIQKKQGDYPAALKNYFKAIELKTQLNDKIGIAKAYSSISSVYIEQQDYPRAQKYLHKAINICLKANDKPELVEKYLKVGQIFIKTNQLDSALIYMQQAFEISKSIEHELDIAKANLLLGEVLLLKQRPQEAQKHFEESSRIYTKIDNKLGLSEALFMLGKHYFQAKNYPEAEQLLTRAYNTARQARYTELENITAELLYKNFQAQNKKAKAFDFLLIHKTLNDSIQGTETAKKITQLHMQRKFDKQQQQQKWLQHQKDLEQTKILNQQKTLRNTFIVGFVAAIIVVALVFRSYKRKKQANLLLKKYNAEIVTQKEEITAIAENLQQANTEILAQKEQIELQNKNISESINYAYRIQTAIMGDIHYIERQFRESFILFSPHSTVSGDFYWFAKGTQPFDYKIIIAADCTGHGVPGALMTVMGHDYLEDIVVNRKIIMPDQILLELDKKVKARLNRDFADTQVQDGMDIVVVTINTAENKLYFAGAKNPLCFVRKNTFNVIKGSKFAIGGSNLRNLQKNFELHQLDILPDDVFYMYSDGFQDQFGKNDRKYLSKRFKQFLHQISGLPLAEQKQQLNSELTQWKGNLHQTDDILVIGIKI